MQVKIYLTNGSTVTTFLSHADYKSTYDNWQRGADVKLGNGSLNAADIQDIKVLDEY